MLHNEFPEGIPTEAKPHWEIQYVVSQAFFSHTQIDNCILPLISTDHCQTLAHNLTTVAWTIIMTTQRPASPNKETLRAMHAQTISLKQQIKGQTFWTSNNWLFLLAVFLNSLTCLSSNNSTSQQWEVISNIKLLYIYLFQLENKISNPADLPTHRWYAAGNPVRWCPARFMSDKTERIFRVWVDVGQITLRRKIGWR